MRRKTNRSTNGPTEMQADYQKSRLIDRCIMADTGRKTYRQTSRQTIKKFS